MSAGTGIEHSEFNPSPVEPVHFLQIWILPEQRGLPPRYDQQTVALDPGALCLIAGAQPRDGAVRLFQDASVYACRLDPGQRVEHVPRAGRTAWLQVAQGTVTLDGEPLRAGDGVASTGGDRIALGGQAPSELLLFDLPA